jgi:hypothetical protein
MHQVYVLKRPGVDTFMKRVGEIFEVVVFTASLAKVPTIAHNTWRNTKELMLLSSVVLVRRSGAGPA